MKFIAKNIASLLIIFSLINLINSQSSLNPIPEPNRHAPKNHKFIDRTYNRYLKEDLPTVAPLTPAADLAIKTGNKFCATNCVTNFQVRTRSCLLKKKISDCKRCTINPKMKSNKKKTILCEQLCNAILPSKGCMYYGYFNGMIKTGISAKLLNKFKLKLIRRK